LLTRAHTLLLEVNFNFQFAYNNSVNCSTGRSPFEVVTSIALRTPVDLLSLPLPIRVSAGAKDFVSYLQLIHAEVRRQIALHNDSYKLRVDSHKRHVEFQPGDLVFIHLRPERFSKGSIHKLHPRRAGPFKVLKHLGPNAYLLDLPTGVSYNPIFNMEDLTLYPGHKADQLPDPPSFPAPATIKPRDEIEAILDD
jgi:hypothetical protein